MLCQMPSRRAPVPRYLADVPLPAYSFVPGLWPHPRKPGGHSHGIPDEQGAILQPDRPRDCRAFLRGLDLFNYGYYWEAHEAWEALWREAQAPAVKALLQGLIRLAAAGVKLRQGVIDSAHRHAQAAQALFAQAAQTTQHPRLCGLLLPSLHALSAQVAVSPLSRDAQTSSAVHIVFAEPLRLV
jgi:predicted metal-dependent hydrolase